MLRARKKDANLKPNRKLDKRSSRGMLFENEELRMRTIEINAEVERGQCDLRKLRRENQRLRRDIWAMRDEYDRLAATTLRRHCPEADNQQNMQKASGHDQEGSLVLDTSALLEELRMGELVRALGAARVDALLHLTLRPPDGTAVIAFREPADAHALLRDGVLHIRGTPCPISPLHHHHRQTAVVEEEEEEAVEEEAEAAAAAEGEAGTKELPWCGCWGNGCF